MPRYLIEADHVEAMNTFYAPEDQRPGIQPNHVWTGDFMGLAHHDIPCPLCFDAPAVLTRNVTIGQWDQKAQPCISCQKAGWRIRLPWWRVFLGLGPRAALRNREGR